jgi:vancomycin resistance protein YoaR
MAQRAPRRPRWGLWLYLLIAAGLLALAATGLVAAYEVRHAGLIYPGVRMGGLELGGMTMDEAAAAIADRYNPYPVEPITIQYGDRTWVLNPPDLGVSVDATRAAAEAFALGRSSLFDPYAAPLPGLVDDLLAQLGLLQWGHSIQPEVRYDDLPVARALRDIARQVDVAAQEAHLQISGTDVFHAPGAAGRRVDFEAMRRAVTGRIREGSGGALELVVQDRQPHILSAETAAGRAKAFFGQTINLSATGAAGERHFAADPATVAGWLVVKPTLDEQGQIAVAAEVDREKIIEFLKPFAKQMSRPAFDAKLDWNPETSSVVVLQPSQTGEQLDLEATADLVAKAVLDPPAGDGPSLREIRAPVVVVAPKVDSDKVAEMGIVEQVSEGTSYFKGSSPERVQNIVAAADKFKGVVVPPGEEFSFNQNVGDITQADGFVDALIIWGDRTAVGIGGGVCQVSTTAYRAAFWGGFPVTERHAHGYVVGWYGEPGMDASIFTPKVDFRFKNDTGHFLLVRSEVDKEKGRITFYFYGTKPDRTVEAGKPVVSNRKPAPPALYQEDPNLAAGQIKQVDWAKEGMDVTVKRTIRSGDGGVKEEKIVSKYRPWQAVYLYGPGTKLPAGAKSGGG